MRARNRGQLDVASRSPAESFQLPGVIGTLVCSAINVSGTIAGGKVTDITLNCVPTT
jgi:hypothetical protein